MLMITWLSDNIVEVFGAVTGIAYVILEIRRNILLWPLGILTSAVYIYVFGRNGFYAGMVLQGYYVVISIYGWYAWSMLTNRVRQSRDAGEQGAKSKLVNEMRQYLETGEQGARSKLASCRMPDRQIREEVEQVVEGLGEKKEIDIRKIDRKTAIICLMTALALWILLWFSLDRWTDSPVPMWDGLITSLSVVATWMLTRKYIEQWYVWIVANVIAVVVYLAVGLYPTAALFFVYFVMAIIGVRAWRIEKDKRQ